MLPSQTGVCHPPPLKPTRTCFLIHIIFVSGRSPFQGLPQRLGTPHCFLEVRGGHSSPHLHRDECGHRGSTCHHSCPPGVRRGPKSYFPSVPVIEEYTRDTRFQEEHVLIDEHVWGAGCQEEYRPSQYLESALGSVHKCRVWRPARLAQELYPGGAG